MPAQLSMLAQVRLLISMECLSATRVSLLGTPLSQFRFLNVVLHVPAFAAQLYTACVDL